MSVLAEAGSYRHLATFYAGREEFAERTLPFIREGVAAGDAMLVVVDSAKIDLLRAELADDAAKVEFADMNAIGRNPAQIIPAWQDFVERHPGRSLRGIGEPIYPERGAAELLECQHHERLLNLALDGANLRLLCPYDTAGLAPDVLAEARRSHPLLLADDGDQPSPDYLGPERQAEIFNQPLEEAPSSATTLSFGREAIGAVRSFVGRYASDAGLSASKSDDLVVALNELATNSVRHGGGTGVLRVWQEPGFIVCEVRDTGQIDDVLIDRRRPRPGQAGGYGLWVANQLCDLLQLRSLASGTRARLYMRLG